MRCPTCTRQGLPHQVEVISRENTLLVPREFWDAEELHHIHDPNTNTTHLRCTRGHAFHVDRKLPCPAPGCTFNEIRIPEGRSGAAALYLEQDPRIHQQDADDGQTSA